MLPKINRIKKKKDFDLIFKKGKSFKTSLLVLKIIKNGSDQNRFGFIVSQKVSKKAVVRNKIRRKLAELVKEKIVSEGNGQDMVFVAFHGIEKNNFADMTECVQNILNKI